MPSLRIVEPVKYLVEMSGIVLEPLTSAMSYVASFNFHADLSFTFFDLPLNTETQFDIMSLQEFKSYVVNSGVDFDGLTNAEKFDARERFDRSRGKLYSYLILSYLSTPLN